MRDHAQKLTCIADRMRDARTRQRLGRLVDVQGPIARAAFQGLEQGTLCEIDRKGRKPLMAEVIGIEAQTAVLSPFGTTEGLAADAVVRPIQDALTMPTGPGLLGRVIDAFGTPVDANGPLSGVTTARPIKSAPPPAMDRPLINRVLCTGLRALDGPLTLGHGQRVGVFGPPGTGKSSLLAAIARHTEADVIVIGLVGERGREVREFLDRDLPPEARTRVVVVVATSDRPPVERALCAHSATTVAEGFRDAGKSVFLMIDSLTRTARALREVGLAAGEPPTRRGYPASVYPALPAIIERAGRTKKADITALYTVLTEGDGQGDPIAEEVKSLTDGHIVLSQSLAAAGHYPAIDVVESLSRSMKAITKPDHQGAANSLRALMVKYAEIELLLQVGEYTSGGDKLADKAIAARPGITSFLRQTADENSKITATIDQLRGVVA